MTANNLCPLESQEQKNVIRWAELQSCGMPELKLLYHIPNGGSRDGREARSLKMEGVKKGVPDLCLPVARGAYHGLYIEMKRVKGGVVSNEQKQWIAALTEQGYAAIVAHGGYEAINIIVNYLTKGTIPLDTDNG